MARADASYKHRGVILRRSPMDSSIWEVLDDAGIVVHTASKGNIARSIIDAMLDGYKLPDDPGKMKRNEPEKKESTALRAVDYSSAIAHISNDDMKKFGEVYEQRLAEAAVVASKNGVKSVIVDLCDVPWEIARTLL